MMISCNKNPLGENHIDSSSQKPLMSLVPLDNNDPYNQTHKSLNVDQLGNYTIVFQKTLKNDHKYHLISATVRQGSFKKVSINSNSLMLDVGDISHDEKYSIQIRFKDDITGSTSDTTINGTEFAHPVIEGTLRTLANPNTNVEGIGNLGYQIKPNVFSKGNYVSLEDTLLNSSKGAKIMRDDNGREYFTTDSDLRYDVMVKNMRTKTILDRGYTLVLKIGKGNLGKLNLSQASKYLMRDTAPAGFVGSPMPTGSYVRTKALPANGEQNIRAYVVGYDKVVGWNHSTYNPGEFDIFLDQVNFMGNTKLKTYDIDEIELVQHYKGNSFDKTMLSQLTQSIDIINNNRQSLGEKPFGFVVDSTSHYLITKNNRNIVSPHLIVIVPVNPQNEELKYDDDNDYALAVTNNNFKDSPNEIDGAITYVNDNIDKEFNGLQDNAAIKVGLHEMGDLASWTPWEAQTPLKPGDQLSLETTTSCTAGLTNFTGLDKKGMNIVWHYKPGSPQLSILSIIFNIEDFK